MKGKTFQLNHLDRPEGQGGDGEVVGCSTIGLKVRVTETLKFKDQHLFFAVKACRLCESSDEAECSQIMPSSNALCKADKRMDYL